MYSCRAASRSRMGPTVSTSGRRAADQVRHGFTLIELLVVIGIVGITTALILSGVSRARAVARSAGCMANLRQIHQAFYQYALDNDKRYPDPQAVGNSWEALLQKYMNGPAAFACPADAEIFPEVGSSYDWRDTPNPTTTLAGRSVSAAGRSDAVLAFDTLPGWHEKHFMNAIRIDGSGEQMREEDCLGDLRIPLAP